MVRPRFVDSMLRDAILRIVPDDDWISQSDLRGRLPRGILPPEPGGRQRLRRTLEDLESQSLLSRRARVSGGGRGPFWRKLRGILRFEAVQYALFKGVRETVYHMTDPAIRVNASGEVYVYGDAVPPQVLRTVEQALEIIAGIPGRAAQAREKLEAGFRLLQDAARAEAKAREVLQSCSPLPPQPIAILAVPFVSKIASGETLWISHTKSRTEDGRIVRRIRRIREPGRPPDQT